MTIRKRFPSFIPKLGFDGCPMPLVCGNSVELIAEKSHLHIKQIFDVAIYVLYSTPEKHSGKALRKITSQK